MERDDARWRAALRDNFGKHPDMFPAAAEYSPRGLVALIARETLRLGRIAVALAAQYGTPSLGNKPDPVDELVYIILTRRTRESAYQRAYDSISGRWRSWESVADASTEEIARTIRASGLGARKAVSIKGALQRLRQEFGTCAIHMDNWNDAQVFEFLVSLPEVGPKSAYCIMAMSLGRSAFAVDAHVGRVMARVAPYADLGLELTPLDHKKRQAIIPPMVPPHARRDLHVNLVAHGRAMCTNRRPACGACPILSDCRFGSERTPTAS